MAPSCVRRQSRLGVVVVAARMDDPRFLRERAAHYRRQAELATVTARRTFCTELAADLEAEAEMGEPTTLGGVPVAARPLK
jgi:hypothetical protein